MNLRQQAKQEKKDRIVAFAREFIAEHHCSPSTQEIASALGFTKPTAWHYLNELNDEKVLCYDGRTILFPGDAESDTQQVMVPLVGVIPCGPPEEQQECIEELIPMSRSLLGPGEFYMLRASGDSMVDAGIKSGDIVVIRQTTEAREGDIVAAIADNESTLKRLAKDSGSRYYLHPENAEKGYPDIWPEQFSIQGVAQCVLSYL